MTKQKQFSDQVVQIIVNPGKSIESQQTISCQIVANILKLYVVLFDGY